ncbi:hypothetical protein [Paenibacillus sacheonensis]|uniref:Uncharacterized protein n=1 Tax=Paenibacillus sacheonensis TaxID=742054 RepID=A0A7X5BYG7_9BACL|nr:hypothetical protein [Paenibacillus sacheonensis]MBM7565380.1 hypothetical protein [Paenibacillus sacheonensis]NBC69692.1 hypothetical protein [Paenibacillus sacheonensis]
MKPSNTRITAPDAFLFNVDLLVESESDAKALEKLLHMLNKAGFADYRIKSGIQLGRMIESLENQYPSQAVPIELPTAQPQADTAIVPSVLDRIKDCIAAKSLIRIMVNKGFGVRLNIPCRILHLDESTQILTVYHVDEKQVYAFSLNEIDDFI